MNLLLATTTIKSLGGGIGSYNYELIKLFSSYFKIFVISEIQNDFNEIVQILFDNKKINNYDYCKDILNFIDDNQIDLIINSSSRLIAILSPFIKCPIISISHFTDGILALKACFNHKFINKIIVLSNAAKKYVIKFYKIKSDKIDVIYNFIGGNPPMNNKIRKVVNIVFPGGSSTKKGVDIVVDVLNLLIKTDLNFNFFWLGYSFLPIRRLSFFKNYSELLKTTDPRIIFTGNLDRSEAKKLIENCNIFLLPSYGEGCAMTLLEAIHVGSIPIVIEAPHASQEILEKGKFGFIVKKPYAKNIFNIIKRLIDDPEYHSDDYELSYNYYNEYLNEKKWKESMIRIMEESLTENKIYKKFNRFRFYKSLISYKLRESLEIFKTNLRSVKFFIILNSKGFMNKYS